jgi:hypothetical protein
VGWAAGSCWGCCLWVATPDSGRGRAGRGQGRFAPLSPPQALATCTTYSLQPPRPGQGPKPQGPAACLMPGAAAKHISAAVWAPPPPGFLQWHEVALQSTVAQMHPVQSAVYSAQHQQQAQQCAVRAGHCGGWRRCACLVLRRGNSGFGGWGTSQYHL